ncbi:MAG: 1-acyl-sn-glycerol-3-phosphate acyltransferase [Parcubacteria group bacterium GW2011_GWC1_42_11]|uniref:1-acyl-sn-glycerol-3-phosphate acyltransferase n=1 Tax=Candidatus Nomurabacteria bacterium GW2011_GWC2_42_20 TaxID=1618756 RepID=A0A0G0ZDZ8_9BACT|nr:MAG: 1-acyl-sn-glycerol-3-phosphate acyltransferase [Parcubacteria group bacterium GW2011_GWC1_42_11]KKS46909.1 MAG: 1-acyl-sn-glycerol-3-phosphate acyltransferase [Candidatus Nomurabacteria bacterium GW2011_GWC2_42_20]HBH71291.1 hypothetical protein [Candidatus Yonathbacteria bacterium]
MHQSYFVDIVYFLIRFFVGPFVRLIWVKKVTGVRNIPLKGPVIVAFNHQSYFDFICFIAVSPRNIHYLSAEKFFKNPLWSFLLKITGQIPVIRKSRDKRELHDVVYQHLSQGKMIGIFPEGTRAHDNTTMLRAYPGVARYAIKKKVPIIPVGIIGAFEILSRHENFPKFKKIIDIKIGKPIYFSEYHFIKLNKRAFGILADRVMREIADLSGKIYPYHNV